MSDSDPNRWLQVRELLHHALELDGAERAEYLVDACKGDVALLEEVESLLQHDDEADDCGFLHQQADVSTTLALNQSTLGGTPAVEPTQEIGSAESGSLPPPHPSHIGPYSIEGLLGEGGFGVVYAARDPKTGQSVAVKVLRRRHPSTTATPSLTLSPHEWRQRLSAFRKEGELLQRLQHPNIVPVYAIQELEDGDYYIVSKLIEGETLAEKMRRGLLPLHEAADIVALVARGLHHAHMHRLVHRDVKPDNILIDQTGQPFVADFGLVLTDEEYGYEATQAGTPSYMSPEQARSEGQLADCRSDIFSLGSVLYEMLTGERPFRGRSLHEVLDRINTLAPRPPQVLRPDVPVELADVCTRAMQKSPDDRYQTAAEMADDLLQFGKFRALRELGRAATEWEESERHPSLLARRSRLRDWERNTELTLLSDVESAYLVASRVSVESRLRLVAIAIALTLLVVAALGTVAVAQRGSSIQRQIKNLCERSNALTKGDTQPQLATMLAVEAMTLAAETGNETSQPEQALRNALQLFNGFPIENVEGRMLTFDVSHDGQVLATGTATGLRLYRLGKEVSLANVKSVPVVAVTFSPSGRWLVAGRADGWVEVCDTRLESPTLVRTQVGTRRVNAVAFIDETRIVTGGDEGAVWQWKFKDEPDAEVIRRFPLAVKKLRPHPTDREELAVLDQQNVHMLKLRGGNAQVFSAEHLAAFSDIVFNADGSLLAAAAFDRGTAANCCVWDTEAAPTEVQLLSNEDAGRVTAIAFHPEEPVLLTGHESGAVIQRTVGITVEGMQVEPNRKRFRGATAEISCVAFTPSGGVIAGTTSNAALYWAEPGAATRQARDQDTAIDQITTRGDRIFLLSEGNSVAGGELRVWNPRALAADAIGGSLSVAISSVSTHPAFATWDGEQVTVFEMRGSGVAPKVLESVSGLSKVTRLVTSRDRRRGCVLEDSNRLSWFDWADATGRTQEVLAKHVHDLELDSAGERLFLSAGDEHTLTVLDTRSGSTTLRKETNVSMLEFSADGTRLAVGFQTGRVDLYEHDASKLEPLGMQLGYDDGLEDIAISYDNRLLAAAYQDFTVHIWSLETGKKLRVLQTPDVVSEIVFTPDGSKLVTGDWVGGIRFYSVPKDFEAQIELQLHETTISSLHLTGDGKWLVSSSRRAADGRGITAVTAMDVTSLVDFARQRISTSVWKDHFDGAEVRPEGR